MPVSLPDVGWSSLDVLPELGIASARTKAGLVVTARQADPFFAGSMTTGNLDQESRADFLAFLIDCVDRNLRVDFVHPRHSVPRAYTPANLPFAGTATVASIPNQRQLAISGLPVGLILKRGDRIGLEQGELRCCRWISADHVVASAISETLPITPRLPLGIFANGDVARFKDAVLRLVVDDSSIEGAEAYGPTPISFNVVEALK